MFSKRYLLLLFLINISFEESNVIDTIELIKNNGYPVESYKVQTKDGYILTVFRIPHSSTNSDVKHRQPVFFQHGMFSSSSDWVLQGNKSLPFILSDMGYDVWLGNSRGNLYSHEHINFTLSDRKFWDFSWHEMGVNDLPAVFSFIENKTSTNGEIMYVGYSMGTTIFFVYASTIPNANETIKLMIALGPVAFMSNVQTPMKLLVPYAHNSEWILETLGSGEFNPSSSILQHMIDYGCTMPTIEYNLCRNLLFLYIGYDDQIDQEVFEKLKDYKSGGGSIKTMIHFAQEIISDGNFQQYDYGKSVNMELYGVTVPPSYQLDRIRVRIFLVSSLFDWFAPPEDVNKLSEKLPNLIGHLILPYNWFHHLDFIWGKDLVLLLLDPILEVLKTMEFHGVNPELSSANTNMTLSIGLLIFQIIISIKVL